MSDLANVAVAPWDVTGLAGVPDRRACASAITLPTPAARGGGVYMRMKVGVEWIVALVLLVLAAPLLAALGLLVKLTSEGPVAYSHLRLGRNGRPFRIY